MQVLTVVAHAAAAVECDTTATPARHCVVEHHWCAVTMVAADALAKTQSSQTRSARRGIRRMLWEALQMYAAVAPRGADAAPRLRAAPLLALLLALSHDTTPRIDRQHDDEALNETVFVLECTSAMCIARGAERALRYAAYWWAARAKGRDVVWCPEHPEQLGALVEAVGWVFQGSPRVHVLAQGGAPQQYEQQRSNNEISVQQQRKEKKENQRYRLRWRKDIAPRQRACCEATAANATGTGTVLARSPHRTLAPATRARAAEVARMTARAAALVAAAELALAVRAAAAASASASAASSSSTRAPDTITIETTAIALLSGQCALPTGATMRDAVSTVLAGGAHGMRSSAATPTGSANVKVVGAAWAALRMAQAFARASGASPDLARIVSNAIAECLVAMCPAQDSNKSVLELGLLTAACQRVTKAVSAAPCAWRLPRGSSGSGSGGSGPQLGEKLPHSVLLLAAGGCSVAASCVARRIALLGCSQPAKRDALMHDLVDVDPSDALNELHCKRIFTVHKGGAHAPAPTAANGVSGVPRYRPPRSRARAPPQHIARTGANNPTMFCSVCLTLVPLRPSAGKFFGTDMTKSALPCVCACTVSCGTWMTVAGDGDCGFAAMVYAAAVSPELRSGIAARAGEESRAANSSARDDGIIARVRDAITAYGTCLQQSDATRSACAAEEREAIEALRCAFAATITTVDVDDSGSALSKLALRLPDVDVLNGVRTFVQQLGSVCGADACYWADSDTMGYFAWLFDAVIAAVDVDRPTLPVALIDARSSRKGRPPRGGAQRPHKERPVVVMRCGNQHWECLTACVITTGGGGGGGGAAPLPVAAWVPANLPTAIAAQLARSLSADVRPCAAAWEWAATAYQMGLVPMWLVPVNHAAAR